MEQESQLEKTAKESRFSRLVDETIDYIEFRAQHPNCIPEKMKYFRNCVHILNKKYDQHERYQAVAKGNKLVKGHFYSRETKKYLIN